MPCRQTICFLAKLCLVFLPGRVQPHWVVADGQTDIAVIAKNVTSPDSRDKQGKYMKTIEINCLSHSKSPILWSSLGPQLQLIWILSKYGRVNSLGIGPLNQDAEIMDMLTSCYINIYCNFEPLSVAVKYSGCFSVTREGLQRQNRKSSNPKWIFGLWFGLWWCLAPALNGTDADRWSVRWSPVSTLYSQRMSAVRFARMVSALWPLVGIHGVSCP